MTTKFTDASLFFFCPAALKCTTLTFGDFFMLMIPVGWMLISIMSVLSYVLVPDEPEWSSASVVSLSAISGIGLVFAIYEFHRHASSYAIEENYNCEDNEEMSFEGKQILMIIRRETRKQYLKMHAVLSTIMAMASIASAIFFGDFASDLGKCTHDSCGPDVAWCGMGLFVSMLWMGATHLGYRDLRNAFQRNETAEDASKEDEPTLKTMEVDPDSPAEDNEISSQELVEDSEYKV